MQADKREEVLYRYYVLRKRYSNSITGRGDSSYIINVWGTNFRSLYIIL